MIGVVGVTSLLAMTWRGGFGHFRHNGVVPTHRRVGAVRMGVVGTGVMRVVMAPVALPAHGHRRGVGVRGRHACAQWRKGHGGGEQNPQN